MPPKLHLFLKNHVLSLLFLVFDFFALFLQGKIMKDEKIISTFIF